METFFIIGLMILLYLVPELMRKKQKKEYEYPKFPESKPQPKVNYMPQAVPELKAEKPIKPTAQMPPAVEVANFMEEKLELSQNVWAQGLIMTEILNPPRARRPMYVKK